MDTLDDLYNSLISVRNKNEVTERAIFDALNLLKTKFPLIWSGDKLNLSSTKFAIEFKLYEFSKVYSATIYMGGKNTGGFYLTTTFDQITKQELEDMIRSAIQTKYNEQVKFSNNIKALSDLLGVKNV